MGMKWLAERAAAFVSEITRFLKCKYSRKIIGTQVVVRVLMLAIFKL
jgi:hypothetical protein